MHRYAVHDSTVCSDEGVYSFVDYVHKKDATSVFNAAYADSAKLPGIRRGSNESCANEKDDFSNALTKLNANGEAVSILKTLSSLSLIYNAKIYLSQHLGLMYVAVSATKASKLTRMSCNNAFLKATRYESVTAVVRPCENMISSSSNKSLSCM